MTTLHEYAYSVTFTATVRVKAENRLDASTQIRHELDGADAHLGTWRDGRAIEFSMSIEGELDLEEVNGEPV